MPRDLLRFRKNDTVIGITGHTQGVTTAMSPPNNDQRNTAHRLVSAAFSSKVLSSEMTGDQVLLEERGERREERDLS